MARGDRQRPEQQGRTDSVDVEGQWLTRSGPGDHRELIRATRQLSEALAANDVLNVMVHEALMALEARSASAWLVDSWGDIQLQCSAGEDPGSQQRHQRLPVTQRSPVRTCIETGKSIWIESQAGSPEWEELGNAPFACLPLLERDQVVGAACVVLKDAGSFGERERSFLLALVQQASQALERERLYEIAQAARLREAGTADLALMLLSAGTEEAIAAALVESAAETLAPARGALWCRRGRDIRLIHQRGMSLAERQQFAVIADDAPVPMVQVLTSRHALLFDSQRTLLEESPALALRGTAVPRGTCTVVMPIVTRAAVHAVLAISLEAGRQLGASELEHLNTLARQGALAFERTAALADERAATSEAQRARARAEDALRAKDEFLAILGHELRNPLAPILTAVQLMKMREPKLLERERGIVERQSQHLVRLVDDLLDVSRIARGKVTLRKQRLDLASVLAKAVETMSPLIEERAHQLVLEIAPSITVHADPSRLTQVFANLLSNAAKYTEPGGMISVHAEARGTDASVTVRDTGAGIGADLLPRLFDLFVQAPQTLERSRGGLGLGLAIVKNLVELHGGRIEVSSGGVGCGSAFQVILPLAGPQDATEPAVVPVIRHVARNLMVMVVDDNRDAAELLAELLETAGYRAQVAVDGPSALELFAEITPDIALVDIGLPGMDGYELGARLGNLGLRPENLVAVTGYGQPEDRQRTHAVGFGHHFVKPVDFSALLQVLLLSASASGPAS